MRFFPGFVLALGVAGCVSSPHEPDASAASGSSAAIDGPAPRAELVFQAGWTELQRGAIVRGGHVDVTHDASRLGKCLSPTIISYAKFSPGGQLFSSDEAFGFDVPDDAEEVALWFHAVAPGCEEWDSSFGDDWRFPVVAAAPADVGWAGDWGSSTSRACEHEVGVPEPITIDEYMRERACIFVDVDVWVPGVTDVDVTHPEWIRADVAWSKDGAPTTRAPLAFQGIVGHNARFRFSVPYEIRDVADWTQVTYAFELTSDGVHTTRIGQPSGAGRTLVRAFTYSGG